MAGEAEDSAGRTNESRRRSQDVGGTSTGTRRKRRECRKQKTGRLVEFRGRGSWSIETTEWKDVTVGMFVLLLVPVEVGKERLKVVHHDSMVRVVEV